MLGGRATDAATIQCGAVLGSGGVYTLTEDLDCTGTPMEVALTVRDGATLDMAGHQLRTSSGGALEGVRLEGEGARLQYGSIEGDGVTGVLVVGTGGHHVQGIRVGSNIGAGVIVTSAHNRLISNETQTLFEGFNIDGDDNWLIGNRAYYADAGFNINGHGNPMLRNRTAQGIFGVFVTGDHNRLIGNTISTLGGHRYQCVRRGQPDLAECGSGQLPGCVRQPRGLYA